MITSNGECKIWNGKDFIYKKWRYNKDGYPVVSIKGYDKNGKTIYRSIAIHRLVAIGFIPNPYNKPEVNHKDFNRANPCADNLEWVTHSENIQYSKNANRYPNLSGENNPNFGNNILHIKYSKNKELAKEKQSRPRGKNGRAKKCRLISTLFYSLPLTFDCQRDAVDYLINNGYIENFSNKEIIIKLLKRKYGYKNWCLESF